MYILEGTLILSVQQLSSVTFLPADQAFISKVSYTSLGTHTYTLPVMQVCFDKHIGTSHLQQCSYKSAQDLTLFLNGVKKLAH